MRDKLIEILYNGFYVSPKDDLNGTVQKAADYLIAHGVTLATDNNVGGKWIPVSERLPDKDGEYFIARNSRFFPGDRPYVQTCYFALNLEEVDDYNFRGQKRPGWYKYDSEYEYYEIAPVHYWMPMPEPPKEEE